MFLSSRILITPWFFFSPVNSTSLFFSFHGFFVISSCGSDLFSFVKDILEACLLKKCWWQTLSENVFILLIYDGFVWHTIPGRQFLSQSFGGLISLISASHVTVGSNNCHLLLIFFFFFLPAFKISSHVFYSFMTVCQGVDISFILDLLFPVSKVCLSPILKSSIFFLSM